VSGPIRLGFALPQFGSLAVHGRQVAFFATEAERLGAAGLWVGDQMLAPGTTVAPEFDSVLDPFELLTVAATVTERVVLGFSMLNLPWYPPDVMARALRTIDGVSGGRLISGFGLGWSPDEYQATGIAWQGRGARLDESLDALEALWGNSSGTPDDVRPVQRPRPPIYLGGTTKPALRRIGRRADGWLPVGLIPRHFSSAILIDQRRVIRAASNAAGRAGGDLPAVLRVNVAAGTSVERIVDTITPVSAETGIQDMFVDLLHLADGIDEALNLVSRLLIATS
jgi:alkanesulfonate monooxygenase SsuD/methylene tetrahydromethanopterin reductase-like flavin-dependent oxidoreductase (luciferase family)